MHITKKLLAIALTSMLLCCSPVLAVSSGDVSAKAAILIEAESKEAVFEKDADVRLPMASTTKIMTALIAVESCCLDDICIIPKEACGIEGSSVYLTEGESLTMEELLYCLMLESANDAATAIAYIVAGGIDEFADLMNLRAAELGLENTHFTNPHGLDDDEHYTTARDLALLTAHALKNDSFAKIVSTRKMIIDRNDGDGSRVLINHNKMLKMYDGAIGVKTGFTKASGRCLVSAAERDGVKMIAVTLSAPSDWSDHKKLLDWGFSKYTSVKFAEPGQFECQLPIAGGTCETVQATNADSFSLPIKDFDASKISSSVETNGLIFAPVKAGDIIGKVVFTYGDEYAGEIPLIAQKDVKAPMKKTNVWDKIKLFFKFNERS